tara:strand:+ start:407 stop:775 length:369 start_codon:yes stop_codon:yes gene_type:complete
LALDQKQLWLVQVVQFQVMELTPHLTVRLLVMVVLVVSDLVQVKLVQLDLAVAVAVPTVMLVVVVVHKVILVVHQVHLADSQVVVVEQDKLVKMEHPQVQRKVVMADMEFKHHRHLEILNLE